MDKQNRLLQLKEKKRLIDAKYESLLKQRDKVDDKLEQLKYEFNEGKKYQKVLKFAHPRNMKRMIRTTGAYILGRRNRKQLYSNAYKRKQASNDLKKYKRALYNEGFVEKTLSELQTMYNESTNKYVKRAIAWELALWYANKQTKDGAEQALSYIQTAKTGETNEDLLRKIAIVEAECLNTLQRKDEAKTLIRKQLKENDHPDLYLALANTETELNNRIKWINHVMEMYQLKPIELCSVEIEVPYDQLRTIPSEKKTNGPKISVILPAYNSEDGIHVAIESILAQTWENIELIIVDDCSTDNTYHVAKSYADKDERVKLLSTPANSGPYVARNIALQEATGEYVTVNDADDWSHAEKLEIQVTHLMEHPEVIANSSEQARLTEDLQFYRRGTPGTYIFPNMSSIMFRRKEVIDRIGYWDTVRFAADGEFKRRLLLAFGKEAFVDLSSGPLSFPRQTTTSLTANSAFGYNGFFMGARKEYVESFSYYHQHGENLRYPAKQEKRLFPVPIPMLPERKKISRQLDVVIVADFYSLSDTSARLIVTEIEKNRQLGLTTGLVQMYKYDLRPKKKFAETIRKQIDGKVVQMIVYGEKIETTLLIVHDPAVLLERQKYIPKIESVGALIIIEQTPNMSYNRKIGVNYSLRQSSRNLLSYFNKKGRWYPLDENVRKNLQKHYQHELKSIQLATDNWTDENELFEEKYTLKLKDWIVF